jgi:hypothetical protein
MQSQIVKDSNGKLYEAYVIDLPSGEKLQIDVNIANYSSKTVPEFVLNEVIAAYERILKG